MNVLVVLFVVVTTITYTRAQNTAEDKVSFVKKLNSDGSTLINENQKAAYELDDVKLLNNRRNERFSYAHAVEEDLLHQNWDDEEKPCLNQLLKVIRNVQNSTLWATWIWDSMQLPVGQLYGARNHLGNFDQCINLPWKDHPERKTQYCLAEIKLSEINPGTTDVDLYGPVHKYIQLRTKHGLTYNNLVLGICAPVVCKQESMAKFAAAMFRRTHLGQMNQFRVAVNSAYCHIAGEVQEYGFQEYIFLSMAIFLVIITLICTWYASCTSSTGAESVSSFAKAFDIKTNVQWLMKVDDKSVRSMMGIRVVSSYFVAAGHLWLTKHVVGIANAEEIDKKWNESSNCGMFNIDITVDIFLMMSGLLLTKSVMEKKNPFLVIAKRYVRLACSLILILLMIPIVYRCGVTGPLVKKYLGAELEFWTANWWRSVLMIGNYGDSENIAYVVLWSLACDFHLFIIGILICWVYQKSRSAGFKVYAGCAVASVLLPFIHGYIHNSGAVTSFKFAISDNLRKTVIGDPAYVRSHLRAGPYFVGMAIGYLMAVFPIEKYRNVISKKSSVFVFFVLVSSFASLYHLSAIYHGRQYGPLEGAVFSVMRRNVFAALIGFLLMLCEYGSLSLVSETLSWSALVPLSKLSYGVYLTHMMFTWRFVATTRGPLWSDAGGDMYSTFGMMTLTFAISLLMWLFWEAPIITLFDNMIFKRFAAKGLTNGNVKINERDSETLDIEDEEHAESELKKKFN